MINIDMGNSDIDLLLLPQLNPHNVCILHIGLLS